MRTESKENLVSSQSTSQNSLNNAVAENGNAPASNENEFDSVVENVLTATGKLRNDNLKAFL